MPAEVWEYKQVAVPRGTLSEETLAGLGLQGWELVQVLPGADLDTLILKRRQSK